MSDTELHKIRASIAINQHLLFALFDAIDDKATVIQQFSAVTEKTSVRTLYSEMPEAYYDEFEAQRQLFLELLADAKGR